MNERIVTTPKPPYYAVIFTNKLSKDDKGYEAMATKMFNMALEQPGCLGAESTRDEQGIGITVSYWQDEQSLLNWKAVAQHRVAQKMGIAKWYSKYEVRIAKVERAYSGPEGRE